MAKAAIKKNFVRDGWPCVIPRIVTRDVEGLVRFIKQVFSAKGRYRDDRPAELRIGDSLIMVSGIGERAPMAALLYVYVANTEATYRRALKAGAKSMESPADTPYGDRRAMIKDRWGNIWQIATYLSV